MTNKGRKILFIWAVAFFLFISTMVLTFAFGLRYDFKSNRLVKTGSIVLRPNIEAQIFINDELEGRTSFLSSSFSKKQLLPGTYTVRVEKDGYFPWQEEIEVKEGLVSDFSRIVLFGQGQVEQIFTDRPGLLSFNREWQKVAYLEKSAIGFYDM